MDFEAIKKAAQSFETAMTKCLRELVAILGDSADEKERAHRVVTEMRGVGFADVSIDGQGNVLGYIGSGKTLIAYDGHIDTVGVGTRENWDFDPLEGYETATEIGGRVCGLADNVL